MANYFSDLHCHTTLFSFNRLCPDTWHEQFHPVFPAQGDFSQLCRGNVRVVMTSLYPIEQGFVTVKPLNIGVGNITDFLAKVIVAMPKQRADEIQKFNHSYFYDLLKELEFLQHSAMPVKHKVRVKGLKKKKFSYRIVSNFNDLKSLLNLDANLNPGVNAEDTIAVILTIEGAHSLGVGQRNTLHLNENELKMILTENISRLKKLGPPGKEGVWCPFFVSLDHHFWNQLGGHAVSLWKVIRKVMDQTPGINGEITEPGKFAVDELLNTENGCRRIFIDTAHMSIKVRRWYYNYLSQRSDNIPVIISHTGVNGIATMEEAEMKGTPDTIHDVADKLYKNSTDFNPWDVFLTDEEIMIIHNSGGIIGLNLDQRIMMGKKRLDDIIKLVRGKSAEEKREIWIKPLLNQILHIAGHILSQTGQPEMIWDNICIGSDFNGMITPIKAFNSAEKFPLLQDTLFKALMKIKGTVPPLTGKTESDIRNITDKIMWKNNLQFLEKHFH
ncbi:MAG TPA: membrane dipeptidase [Draconibacterium sp.]|nr:membrane dipeptidase [Draconibacterium sp.]